MPNKLLAEWFWVDRWMGSSAFGLPLEARGLYREMLSQAWRREARLPNDHEQIQRFIGVTASEWKRAWPRVECFWRVDGEWLVNDTQLEVYADAYARAQAAHERGLRGAQALHKKRVSITQAPASISISVADQEPPVAPLVGGRSEDDEVRLRMAEALRRPRRRA